MAAVLGRADEPPPGYTIGHDIFSAEDQTPRYVGEIVRDHHVNRWDLFLRTQEEYRCLNMHINATQIINEENVSVRINKGRPVLQPTACIASSAPASYRLALPVGNKPLTLDILSGEKDDRYKISFETNVASVSTIHASFTIFLHSNDKSR